MTQKPTLPRRMRCPLCAFTGTPLQVAAHFWGTHPYLVVRAQDGRYHKVECCCGEDLMRTCRYPADIFHQLAAHLAEVDALHFAAARLRPEVSP